MDELWVLIWTGPNWSNSPLLFLPNSSGYNNNNIKTLSIIENNSIQGPILQSTGASNFPWLHQNQVSQLGKGALLPFPLWFAPGQKNAFWKKNVYLKRDIATIPASVLSIISVILAALVSYTSYESNQPKVLFLEHIKIGVPKILKLLHGRPYNL